MLPLPDEDAGKPPGVPRSTVETGVRRSGARPVRTLRAEKWTGAGSARWYKCRMRYSLSPLVATLFLALAPPALATVLVPGDLGDLARGAAAIVRGRVVDVRPEWADGRRRVETIVTLEVAESYKGDLAGQVTFAVPGGVMGRYRSVMVGAPSFQQGEEVVLFLGARPPSLPYVLGLGQGVFRVLRDARTGQAVVTPPALLADPFQGVQVVRGDPSRRAAALDEFSATLRAAISSARPKGPRRDPPRAGDVIRGGR